MSELREKVAVITGGGGILCGTIAQALGRLGGRVVLLDIQKENVEHILQQVESAGGSGLAVQASVLERADLERAREETMTAFGRIDILINGAGGSHPRATTGADQSFFDLPEEGVRAVFDLNFLGTFLACEVFGRSMVDRGEGVILNISSMSAFRPLTRVPAYSAAKAAVSNFTQWLAVHMAQEHSPRIRVNAIAPGFFITAQNRFLLQDEHGNLTERGRQILAHTPAARFGKPEDLLSAVEWLLSPRSAYVTGVVVPIDGGFAAYSGV